ncbi:Met4p KNAG_0I01990 [Huiozyma naganishii CBS 8797]|uniref:BZIP domain-containing protein n=1 Tax=Huiozyma naganishii (strain ATCC MYA-139 / BCRC 22969 / CBS 8797 / KCTC 17520 / NBRC 10181 / NCYC 3082 / Yp74L-3) TaxID=1071383 RepID=J7S9B0_HUIN7|nr:hypothetical protein KNAG_0I01990 [Kazachstania naganishii CBS 8797]CCK71984.1 hypothetical protein KNAG_0I01990 [Kazachstania naganishii CBS 8797]
MDYNNEFVNLYGKDAETDGDVTQRTKDPPTGATAAAQTTADPMAAPTDVFGTEHASLSELDGANITPNILLEQLAYVDNFMPTVSQDFMNLDSWILNESAPNAGGDSNGTHTMDPNNALQQLPGGNSTSTFGLDEQLAAELSAFADDAFVFPDEDKPLRAGGGGSGGEDGEDDEDEAENSDDDDGVKKDSHFLTQRRNTFLTSQYSHSKSRFSANKRKLARRDDDATAKDDVQTDVEVTSFSSEHTSPRAALSNTPPSTTNAAGSPDHGGFTNYEIGESNKTESVIDPLLPHRRHTPSVSSSLNNVLAARREDDEEATPAATTEAQIKLPDYSKIPTDTLVALLPTIEIPRGIQETLTDAGFNAEQIQALSAILAYHEQGRSLTQAPSDGELHSRVNDLDDSDPLKRSVSVILGLAKEKERFAQENESTYISSLIESSNKRLNELKNKLDQQSHAKKRPLLEPEQEDAHTVQRPPVKKRQKEKELEKSLKELNELASSLQQRIHTLELENKLLKNLVMNSVESEGIEKAESIKQKLLKNISDENL